MGKNKRVLVTIFFFMMMMSSMFFLETNYESKGFRIYSRFWKHGKNSIDHSRESLKNGYRGIKLDVVWSRSNFYLSDGNGSKLSTKQTLKKFLEKTKDYNYNLWINFKNLGFFNARKACSQLNTLLDDFERFQTTVIESNSFYALHLCRQSKLHVSFLFNSPEDTTMGRVLYWIDKKVQSKYQFEFVSLNKYAGERIIKEISSQYTTLIFTIRNEKEKNMYLERKNIKVMLVSDGVLFN